MQFTEHELIFSEPKEKGLFDADLPGAKQSPTVDGITIRLSNQPLVKNLKSIFKHEPAQISSDLKTLFQNNDIYIITHAIGIIRTSGNAKVKEIQFNGEIQSPQLAKTIDLLPSTHFNTKISSDSKLEGLIMANGNFTAQIPPNFAETLTSDMVTLGGETQLQLAANSKFIGQFQFGMYVPSVVSSGIATNKCTWILKVQQKPLLGDQLLLQTISVPKGTRRLEILTKAVVRVSKGFFSGDIEQETAWHNIEVNLA